MAGWKLWLVWIVLALVILGGNAEAVEEIDESAKGLELEQLRSKISALEHSIADIRELKNKDDRIALLEKVAHEKAVRIASLESEIESLQKKGSVDAQELLQKADARIIDLEKQVYGVWLPPWIDLTVTFWKENLKPTLNVFLQKVSEKSVEAWKSAGPHLETARTKWIPAAMQQSASVTASAKPHVQSMCTKTAEFYETSKSMIIQHVVKAQEIVDPYVKEAKKMMQIATPDQECQCVAVGEGAKER